MRQVLQSNNAIILASPSPSFATGTGRAFSLMAGVIDSSYSFSVSRETSNQVGSQFEIVDDPVRNVDVDFSFESYLTPNFLVERYLNLDANNTGEKNMFSTLDDEDDQTFIYLIHPDQGFDAIEEYRKPDGTRDWSGYDMISIGNSFLNSYSISLSVGALPTISTNWSASNLTYQRLTGNSASSPAINLVSGNQSNVESIVLDPLESGHPNIASPDDLSLPGVIVPGDVLISMENIQAGGQPMGVQSHIFQSLNLNVDIPRSASYGFGSNYVYGREIQYPLVGSLSFNGLVSGFNSGFSGFLSGITSNESKYDISISFWNDNHTGTLNIEDAKLQNYSSNMPVNEQMVMSASFSFLITSGKGLKSSSLPSPIT